MIILKIFDPIDEEIEYWKENLQKIIDLGYESHVLIDNPKFNESIFNGFSVFKNEVNLGKFDSLVQFINNYEGDATHFKVFDFDDKVDLDELAKYELPDFKGVIVSKAFGHNFITNESINGNENPTFANFVTIFPVQYVKNNPLNDKLKGIRVSVDNGMGIVCALSNSGVLHYDHKWYIYQYKKGVTAPGEHSGDALKLAIHSWSMIIDLIDESDFNKDINEYFNFKWYTEKWINTFKTWDFHDELRKEAIEILNRLFYIAKNKGYS